MKGILNILGSFILSLGILGLVILHITNQPIVVVNTSKAKLTPVFEQSGSSFGQKTTASNLVSGKGSLRLGSFAFFQLTGNDSELELLQSEFNTETRTVSEASGKIHKGGVLAVNLVFGQKLSLEDERVKVISEGGSFIFENKEEFAHIKVLSGSVKLEIHNPKKDGEIFEAILVADEKVLLTENSIEKIFATDDSIQQIFAWNDLIGNFSSSYPGESNMLTQLLDVINVEEKGKLELALDWSKEKLLFAPGAVDRFYASQIDDLLGRVANGNSKAVSSYLTSLSPNTRESLMKSAVGKTHYTKLFVGKELPPNAKKRIAELGEFDEYFASLTKTEKLPLTYTLNRDLVLLADNTENKEFKANFFAHSRKAGESDSQFVNASWLVTILIENPKIITKEWLEVFAQLNRIRAKTEGEIYHAFADQIRLTDFLIHNNYVSSASQSLKDFATMLNENSDLFSDKELEVIATYGNDLKNKIVFVTTISENNRFDEKKYQAWIAEKNRIEEEELAAAIASGERRVARPKSEFEKFLDFLSFAEELEIGMEDNQNEVEVAEN